MSLSSQNIQIPVHEFEQDKKEDELFDLFPLLPKTEKSTTSPHRHDYFELLLFDNGGGTHLIDFQEIKIEPYSAHLVAPGQVHHLKRSDNSLGYVAMFMEDFLRNNLENRHFISKFAYMEMEDYQPFFQFSKEEFSDMVQLIQMMEKEMSSPENLNLDILRHYINILILSCRKKKFKQIQPKLTSDQLLYADFRKQVNLKYKELKKVKEYAQLLNTNERCINEVSQKGSGKSASTIIYERIIMEAMRLIVNTDLSVKEICFELNYEDQAHFSKFFKKQSGFSPSQFRELYK